MADLEHITILIEGFSLAHTIFDLSTIPTAAEIEEYLTQKVEGTRRSFGPLLSANIAIYYKISDQIYFGIGGRESFNMIFWEDETREDEKTSWATELESNCYIRLSDVKRDRMLSYREKGSLVLLPMQELETQEKVVETKNDILLRYSYFTFRPDQNQTDLTQAKRALMETLYPTDQELGVTFRAMSEQGVSKIEIQTMALSTLENTLSEGGMICTPIIISPMLKGDNYVRAWFDTTHFYEIIGNARRRT